MPPTSWKDSYAALFSSLSSFRPLPQRHCAVLPSWSAEASFPDHHYYCKKGRYSIRPVHCCEIKAAECTLHSTPAFSQQAPRWSKLAMPRQWHRTRLLKSTHGNFYCSLYLRELFTTEEPPCTHQVTVELLSRVRLQRGGLLPVMSVCQIARQA